MVTHAQSRFWKSKAFRVCGSVAILAALAMLLPVGEIVAQMRRVPAPVWLLTLAGFMAVQVFVALKFHLLLRSAGAPLPLSLSIRCYFAALFGNVFLPSIVGGDVVSIGLAMRYSGNRAGVALGAFVSRTLDFVGLGLLTLAGAALLHAELNTESRRVFWSVIAALVGAAALASLTLVTLLRRRYSFRMRRRLVKLRRAARAMRAERSTVLLGVTMAFAAQAALVLLVWWLGRESGMQLALSIWLFAWPLAKLAALAPISIGGIGAREAAFAAILLPFGVAASQSVAVGLLYEAVSLSGGLLAGMLSWIIARQRAPVAAG